MFPVKPPKGVTVIVEALPVVAPAAIVSGLPPRVNGEVVPDETVNVTVALSGPYVASPE